MFIIIFSKKLNSLTQTQQMKKTIQLIGALCLSYLVVSCTKDSLEQINQNSNSTTAQARENGEHERKCGSMEVLEQNIKDDPKLKDKMDEIERFTEEYVKKQKKSRVGVDAELVIPVVVNVLWATSAENISATQIQSQIDILNRDFSATNTDLTGYNGIFKPLASDYKIKFVLQNVVRKQTNKTSWGTRDTMKSTKRGGINPTSPTTVLNMWVCTIGGGILGYAQFPGGSASTDGVVMDSRYFGNSGAANAPYNLGRTATHEVGHWLNLRHIWGDATCGSDLVADTPTHNTANYGCPTLDNHRSTCTGTPIEMTQNYMDYTNDACMFMFTAGQRVRSRALFEPGGPRASFNL